LTSDGAGMEPGSPSANVHSRSVKHEQSRRRVARNAVLIIAAAAGGVGLAGSRSAMRTLQLLAEKLAHLSG
jgi:hypothetical protein